MIWLQITSLAYMSILLYIYFSEKRIESLETTIFKIIMIANEIGIIIDILCYITVLNIDRIPILTAIVTKSLLVYYIIYVLLFTYYLLSVSHKTTMSIKQQSFAKILCAVYFLINLIFIIMLPMYYNSIPGKIYSYGPSVTFLFYSYTLLIIIWCIDILINFKNLKKKKVLPIILLVVLGTIAGIIQKIHPEILLMTGVDTVVTFLMYFTIENPDVKMIEQLNVERDRADKANNAKTDFLSSMSHEIRTPLNAIVGFSQALSEEDLPPQAQEEVKDIVMASETLLDIVNGILDISKIEADKLEIVNTEYNFNDLLNELVALSKARIGEKPLEFRHNFSPDIPKYMYGDKVRVKQVILNLLTNAIKYTKEGWIEFKVNCVNKNDICRLIISVQDTGMGIKQENINKLFNRFERLDIEKNNTIEGTGLGLAITKKLINLMGGQIVVQSIYGEGSKFTIAIDQKIVTNPTNPALEKTQELAIGNLNLTNKRILIVDDNKINLKVAARLLQDYHCIIDMIDNGADCIEKIKIGASYDLILMDDMMPKMSGVETFHHLQEIPDFKTPVIALTANAISGMREKYLAEGFNDYLSKPIDKTELNKVLNKYLG